MKSLALTRSALLIACLALSETSVVSACDRALANAYEQNARDAGENTERKARYFQNAIEECPKTPKTYADLSDALLQLDQIDEAESVIKRGVKVDPGHSEVRRVYGDVLRKRNDLNSALEQYTLALRYASIPRDRFYALANMGWAHHGLGDHTESTKAWATALNINIVFDPVTNRKLYNMVAWNHAACRTPEVCDGAVAVEFYERNPVRYPAWNELGTGAAAYARLGDFATAVALQEKSISLIRSTDILDKDRWLSGAMKRMKLYQQGIAYTDG